MWYKWRFIEINIHFTTFTNYPPFASKQTFARIDFLRQGERLVDKNGTFSVKYIAEKWTKRYVTITYAHGQQQGKHVRLQPTAQAVAGHAVYKQRKQHHENAEVIGHWRAVFKMAWTTCITPFSPLKRDWRRASILFLPTFCQSPPLHYLCKEYQNKYKHGLD